MRKIKEKKIIDGNEKAEIQTWEHNGDRIDVIHTDWGFYASINQDISDVGYSANPVGIITWILYKLGVI